MQPLISIVIPVYNTEQYLIQCLESVINQTYNNIEIIVVDDNSPGNCQEICQQYPMVKYLSYGENRGLFRAREHGVRHAAGEYIIHVDSDDWITHELCDDVADIIKQYSPDCINFKVITIKKDIKTFDLRCYPKSIDVSKEFFTLMCQNNMPSEGLIQKIYRREIVLKVYNEISLDKHLISSEDLLFNLWCAYYCEHVFFLDKHYYYYRVNEGSSVTITSLDKFNKVLKDNILALEQLDRFAVLKNLPLGTFDIIKLKVWKYFFEISHALIMKQFDDIYSVLQDVIKQHPLFLKQLLDYMSEYYTHENHINQWNIFPTLSRKQKLKKIVSLLLKKIGLYSIIKS